ncbi:MAG: ral stress protein 69 [Verrucomicrobiota bacterium]|jgi:aryl-alcohol dehydrogenase-like predicted oxidoreductase
MIQRPLGPSQIQASCIGLGTWAIGGWMWGGVEEQEAERAIRTAIDHGITLIDTAPAYGFGRSEEIVGRAIRPIRDSIVLATKCGLVWDRTDGIFHFASDDHGANPEGHRRIHRYLNPQSIRKEVETSLRRMRTDWIDLYQTHWQDASTPVEDTMLELLKLKQEGKIRAIGVCNASSSDMQQYRTTGQLDTDQEKYSMLDRAIEADQLPFCQNHDLGVLAYSPLSLGLLTGKISSNRQYGRGDLRPSKPRFAPEFLTKVDRMLHDLLPTAKDLSLTLSQLVIAWTLAQPGITHALVGARRPEHAIENAGGGRTLDNPTLERINTVLAEHNLTAPN